MDTCDECKHGLSVKGSDYLARTRYPPVVIGEVLAMNAKSSGTITVESTRTCTTWPLVKRNEVCGEFSGLEFTPVERKPFRVFLRDRGYTP